MSKSEAGPSPVKKTKDESLKKSKTPEVKKAKSNSETKKDKVSPKKKSDGKKDDGPTKFSQAGIRSIMTRAK